MGSRGSRSTPGRRRVLVTVGTAALTVCGCLGGDPEGEEELVVEETIDASEEWVLDLAAGDRLRIVAEDGSDTTLIDYTVEPPGGRGTSQRVVGVDRTIEAEEGGEYVIRIDPSQETEVRIYRS